MGRKYGLQLSLRSCAEKGNWEVDKSFEMELGKAFQRK